MNAAVKICELNSDNIRNSYFSESALSKSLECSRSWPVMDKLQISPELQSDYAKRGQHLEGEFDGDAKRTEAWLIGIGV